MFIRVISSAVLGLTVTAGLIYLMNYLIEISEAGPDESPKRLIPIFLRTIEDTPLVVDPPPPVRPDPPAEPPLTRSTIDQGEETIFVRTRPDAPPSPEARWQLSPIGYADGGLMTVVAVRPTYPASASERGLEGHVIVRFDVSEFGTVQNIAVVESSNRIFEKAAVNAASRFKFKPKVVDGVPQPSFGVQRLFTFRMEKN